MSRVPAGSTPNLNQLRANSSWVEHRTILPGSSYSSNDLIGNRPERRFRHSWNRPPRAGGATLGDRSTQRCSVRSILRVSEPEATGARVDQFIVYAAYGSSCMPPTARSCTSSRHSAGPRHAEGAAPAAGPPDGAAVNHTLIHAPAAGTGPRSAHPAPGTRPASSRGRMPQRCSPLLSACHSTCSSSPSVRQYSACEPPLAGLRRAVKPAPLPGCTRRMDQSGKATLTRANSAAGVQLTSRRPHPPGPEHGPGQVARHTAQHAAAAARRRPRPADAGRPHLGAVNRSACLKNADRLPSVTTMHAHT